jgi:hypothetical protein
VEADNALTSCQSSTPLAADAESSKVGYKPLHHAVPIKTFATFPRPATWLSFDLIIKSIQIAEAITV